MKADGFSPSWCSRAALAAAFLSGWACVITSQAQSPPGALVGKPAPSFQLQGIYSEHYSLDQFKGHILVMQFGSSW
jgi:hypothetical protein